MTVEGAMRPLVGALGYSRDAGGGVWVVRMPEGTERTAAGRKNRARFWAAADGAAPLPAAAREK